MQHRESIWFRKLTRITLTLVLVLMLYGLSVGPAVWCMEYGLASEATLEIMYWPLTQTATIVPPLYWLLDEYACFFQ